MDIRSTKSKVSIPYGKGKDKQTYDVNKETLEKYQFPMGKVKMMKMARLLEAIMYQFPMGKVKDRKAPC